MKKIIIMLFSLLSLISISASVIIPQKLLLEERTKRVEQLESTAKEALDKLQEAENAAREAEDKLRQAEERAQQLEEEINRPLSFRERLTGKRRT